MLLTGSVLYAQDNYFFYDGGPDIYFRYLPRGQGGRVLVHEVGNTLILNYGGDFTGGVRVHSDLHVSNSVLAKRLFLSTGESHNGWSTSVFDYAGHTLRIGSPEGVWAHNHIAIQPRGCAQEPLYSWFTLGIAKSENEHEQRVQLHTNGVSYFNGGNVGIGTDTPRA